MSVSSLLISVNVGIRSILIHLDYRSTPRERQKGLIIGSYLTPKNTGPVIRGFPSLW